MKVAVVGSGIAGMLTARRLFEDGHEVTVYEARNRIGGHAATRSIEVEGRRYVVDGGFSVFHEKQSPAFVALLDELGITRIASDVSLGVEVGSDTAFSGSSLATLFARRRNVASPTFWKLLRDVARFRRERDAIVRESDDGGRSLRTVIEARHYSRAFVDQYLVPLSNAIWSCSGRAVLDMSATSVVPLLADRAFIVPRGATAWRTIDGGSRAYARALLGPLSHRVRLAAPVRRVKAKGVGHVTVKTEDGPERYDRVVLACHADQSLKLLSKPSETETEVLGAFHFEPNEVVLHTDASVMPEKRGQWASWNVRVDDAAQAASAPARVTYWMNSLQSIDGPDDLFVTLNRTDEIDDDKILKRKTFHHPRLGEAAVRAQRRFDEIDGSRGVHYCGAWWGDGLHESGVRSALRVLERLRAAAD